MKAKPKQILKDSKLGDEFMMTFTSNLSIKQSLFGFHEQLLPLEDFNYVEGKRDKRFSLYFVLRMKLYQYYDPSH